MCTIEDQVVRFAREGYPPADARQLADIYVRLVKAGVSDGQAATAARKALEVGKSPPAARDDDQPPGAPHRDRWFITPEMEATAKEILAKHRDRLAARRRGREAAKDGRRGR